MDVRVQPSGKIALVAHCILNQNAKPHLRARYPAIATPVLDVLTEEGFALFQLPCPEVGFGGLHRFSQVIEQYDTAGYRAHCRELSTLVLDQLEQYLRQGCAVVTIGIDGSPSCGVHFVGSNPDWKGYPSAGPISGKYPVRKGKGLFVRELEGECAIRELPFPKGFGVGLDLPNIDLGGLRTSMKKGLQDALGERS